MAGIKEIGQETELDNDGHFLRKRNFIRSAQDKLEKGN